MAQVVDIAGTERQREIGQLAISVYTRDTFLDMLEKDLDKVFIGSNGQEFAENQNSINYHHATGEKTNYPVIFDNPYTGQNVNAGAEFTGLKPQIMVQETKLLRAIRKNDRVQVRGVWYFVEDYHSDGVGVTTVFLRRK